MEISQSKITQITQGGLKVKAGVVGWCKITKNGQVTLPKEIRDQLRLKSGDFIQFLITDNHQIILRKFTLSECVEL